MSSIMETRTIPSESRSKMFLRSNSFQKLCSLAHPFRLKGFKSNKEALKSVFESLIVTTRGVIQSVTYRILCFLFLTPFAKLLSRPLNLLTAGNKDGNKLDTVRLILRLTLSMIISTDKTGEECDTKRDAAVAVTATDETSPERSRRVNSAVQTEDNSDDTAELAQELEPEQELDLELEQYFDCKEGPGSVAGSATRRRELALSRLLVQPPALATPRRKRLSPHHLAVYGCVLCLFLQLSALGYLLNVAARIPPGLIFLISALGYIGYVMMRIFSSKRGSSNGGIMTSSVSPTTTTTTTTMAVVLAAAKTPKRNSRTRRTSSTTGFKGIHPLLEAVGRQVASVVDTRALVPIGTPSPRMSLRRR